LLKWANGKKVFTAVDPKPENALKFYGADLIRPNLMEAIRITGKKGEVPDINKSYEDYSHFIKDLSYKLRGEVNSKYTFITLSQNGIAYLYQDKFGIVRPEQRDVKDVTGAGDTALSILGLSILSGASPLEACVLSNTASGIVVGKFGTSVATPDEIREVFLREHSQTEGIY